MGKKKIEIKNNFLTKIFHTKNKYYEMDLNYLNDQEFDLMSLPDGSPYSQGIQVMDYSDYSCPPSVSQVEIKRERASPVSSDPYPRRRPGRLPAKPDESLDEVEYERRARRRERNRLAAARCRERRLEKVSTLEDQIKNLKAGKQKLAEENKALQEELRRLRFQVQIQPGKPAPAQYINTAPPCYQDVVNNDVGYTVTFTPLLMDKSFEFPLVQKSDLDKVRNESLTDFNQLLTCL